MESKDRQSEYAVPDSDIDMDGSEPGLEGQKHKVEEFELDETSQIAWDLLRAAAEKVLGKDLNQEDTEMEDAPDDSAEDADDEDEDDDDDETDEGEETDESDEDIDEEESDEERSPVVTEGIPPWGIRFTRNRPKPDEQANNASRTPMYQHGRCDICGDTPLPSNISIMSCAHAYCSECTERLIEVSIANESMFPPSCCRQAIVIDRVKHMISKQLLADYYEKKREFEALDRIYCCKPDCSTLIPSECIKDDIGTCQKCGTELCINCKFEAHGDEECPEDWELHDFLDLAAEKGWARCDACGRVIERDYGCNHMVCHCRYEFCFACGAEWSQCDCQEDSDEEDPADGEEQEDNVRETARAVPNYY